MASRDAFKNKPIIWILGGPGSGKGTQCEKIREFYGFVHLSSGDLLRDEGKSDSVRGKQIHELMVKGLLVPREIVLELIKSAMLKEINNAKGFLIDGYPREVEQGVDFEKLIGESALIIYFVCSDETMTKRLASRGLTSGRSDDNEETIKKRLVTFHNSTKPVIKKFASKVAKIEAERDPNIIFEDCRKVIDDMMKKHGQGPKTFTFSTLLCCRNK